MMAAAGDGVRSELRRARLPSVVALVAALAAFPLLYCVPLFGGPWIYKILRWRIVVEDGITCAHCGYNLTGLPEPRCPECGQPFEPKGDAP